MKRSDIKTIDVLAACKEFHSKSRSFPLDISKIGPAPYEIIAEKYSAPEKIVYAAMEREYERGYIEYGTTLRCGWLTEKGEKMLSFLLQK